MYHVAMVVRWPILVIEVVGLRELGDKMTLKLAFPEVMPLLPHQKAQRRGLGRLIYQLSLALTSDDSLIHNCKNSMTGR